MKYFLLILALSGCTLASAPRDMFEDPDSPSRPSLGSIDDVAINGSRFYASPTEPPIDFIQDRNFQIYAKTYTYGNLRPNAEIGYYVYSSFDYAEAKQSFYGLIVDSPTQIRFAYNGTTSRTNINWSETKTYIKK